MFLRGIMRCRLLIREAAVLGGDEIPTGSLLVILQV